MFKIVPKSNKNYALNLLKKNIEKKKEGKILQDERFQSLFDNSDFEIDQNLNSSSNLTKLKSVNNTLIKKNILNLLEKRKCKDKKQIKMYGLKPGYIRT